MRLTILAAVSALLLSPPAFAQERSPTRTISVMGTGEAESKPDFARIFVAVETQADTVAQAASANNAASERVLERIQALGIRKDDIRTVNFQVFQTPVVERSSRDAKPVPKFTANHRLQITTRDLPGVGRLAGEILASGDMTFQSVSFGLDRQDAGGDSAREAAVKDAMRQADVYAKAAGVSLGRVMEIRDGSAQPFQPQPEMRMQMAMAKGGSDVPIVPPATIRYNAGVQIVWEIASQP
ncbi:SIMPL domain-containing protein [Microvirga antarctica]|uniref:SIMPL domain-containing protein n=1 Tax=Microvirga antarctica TaxID=2819233 RepID=UPI001B312934|nr:SIMPL domain-containing protein [Microvirga antarctica]